VVSDEPKPPEPSHQPESGIDGMPARPAAGSASEPPAEGAEPESGSAGREQAKGGRGRTVGIVLAIVLSGVTLLCVGGLGMGYLFYRQASEPDRTTPTVAVDQYLNATFVLRDASRAKLFTCGDPESIKETQDLLRDISEKEGRLGVHIAVSWESLKASTAASASTVDGVVRLNTTIGGVPQEEIEQWRFSVSHRSGWRVCDARKAG
jgi:hypothetical protein